MKKLLAIILCLVMCVGAFAACAKSDNGGKSQDTASTEQSAPASSEDSSADSSEDSSEESVSEDSYAAIEHIEDAAIRGDWYMFMEGIELCISFKANNVVVIAMPAMDMELTGTYKTNDGTVYISGTDMFDGPMAYVVDGIKISLTDEEGVTQDMYQRELDLEDIMGFWGGFAQENPQVFYLNEGGTGYYKTKGVSFPVVYDIRGEVLRVEIAITGTDPLVYEFAVDGGVISAENGVEFYSLLPSDELCGVWEESGRKTGYSVLFDEIGIATFYESSDSYFIYDAYEEEVVLMFLNDENGEVYYIEAPYSIEGDKLTINLGGEDYIYTKRSVDTDVIGSWVQEDAQSEESAMSFDMYEGGFGVFAIGTDYVMDITYTTKNGKLDMTVVGNGQAMNATYVREGDKLSITMDGETIVFVKSAEY